MQYAVCSTVMCNDTFINVVNNDMRAKYLYEFIILCVRNALCAIRLSVQCIVYNIVVCAI